MKSWILNIVGIVFIGVIIEIILPDGKSNTFIKHIFNIFMLFVIVAPITKIVNNGLSYINNTVEMDNQYIYQINLEKINSLEVDIKKELEKIDINNTSVIVNANIFSESFCVESIYLDVSNSDIDNTKYKSIIDLIVKLTNVDEKDIVVYGFKN